MTDVGSPDQERLRTGYERMLAHLRERFAAADKEVPSFAEAVTETQQQMVEAGELSAAEAEQVARYLRRDAEEAGAWLAQRADDDPHLGDWLRMDLQMLESWLWDAFSSIADRTKLELQGFTTTGEPSLYHTGEVCGPGTLQCLACGREITFTRPDPIPRCPGCEQRDFVRIGGGSDTGETA
ncbi:hypothetical protein CKO15_01960 [Halorhodospira abdelmalekii]|uniref:zinc ribbon-containing protein n=1 Tax=Halorhodospira abdelmalekii TaxID=421629 RepID=UPI001905CC41|nr:zinc ribbon-containing protein [Halorhodospira abdelmalekii]MBK1734064.1 hypothetical protein [Halorhodospira abdelmalekii]